MWGLKAPDQAMAQLSLFPSSGMKVPPPSSVSLPLSKTIFLFYCSNHFRRTPVFYVWPRQAFSAGRNRRSHSHRLQVDPVKASASLHSLSHTHTELNPHIFLLTFSVLSVFCNCHQELHVLKHLWAPGFIKDLFFGRIPFIYLISPQKTLIGMLSAAFIQFQQDSSGLGITINRMLQNKSKHKITLSLARKRFDYLHFRTKKLQKALLWSLKAWLVPNWNVASKQVCPSNLILTGISLSWFVPSLVTGRECRARGIADGAIPLCTDRWGFYV